MEFINKYGTLIWIIIAIIAIVLVIKLIKKAIALIMLIIFLLVSGSIPYSTVNTVIDTTKTTYQKTAALWSVETIKDQNGNESDKTIYIFNKIPIKINTENNK